MNQKAEPRDFSAFLLDQSQGRTHSELSEGLRDLVAKVVDTGKKGSIQLTVTVAPMKDDASVLVVSDEIKLKLPEHDRKASIFWPDDNNNLVRNDPNQRSIFDVVEVERATATVNIATGEILED